MVTGPQQQRLDLALRGASAAAVADGVSEWTRCAGLLKTVGRALEKAGVTGQGLGGETGPAMSASFARTAEGMAGKSEELRRGSEALRLASNAIIKADVGRTDMNRDTPQLPHPGPYVPPVDGDDVTATGTYKGDLEDHETSFNNREERARQLADALDEEFRASTETMKSIHGEPDPEPPDDDATSGQPGPIGTPPPAGGGRPPTPGGHHTVSVVGEPVDTTHHITPVPNGQETPTPQLPVPTHHVTPPTTASPVPDHGTGLPPTGTTGLIGGTSTGGVSAPLAGGLGVVAGGGLAGAAISGIRGGFAPASAAAGAPARPIGSSTRAGAPGALGRGGAAGTGAPASRPTGGRGTGGRGGLGGRGGAAGAGGGAGGRGGRRGGAAAGAGGAAAGRRGGKKDQDEQGRDRDLFDDGQDWIDDAEAAPGVID